MKYRNFSILVLAIVHFCIADSFCQKAPVCFAWLSDTHVGSSTGAEDLRAAVRDINDIKDIDFVILSGDITEMGSNAELEAARAILDSLNKPYHIIPGNHDTKWSESGGTRFIELWGSDKFDFEFRGYRFIGMHQGPLMRMGDGHFAPEDLRWLDAALNDLPDKNQPLIFITHYPIDASVGNWYEFLDRVKRNNAQVILCGHGHLNKVYSFEGIPGVMGRSTLRRDQPRGGYNIVEIKNDSMFYYERKIEGISHQTDDSVSQEKNASNTAMRHAPCAMVHPWHKLSLQQRDFSSDVIRYRRPDFSINEKYPEVSIKWALDTQASIAASPCVWRQWVVIGNREGRLAGLLLNTGKIQWTFQINGSIFSSPAAADGKVIFAATDGKIYCLDIENGRVLWTFATGRPVVAAPKIDRGMIYIGSSDGRCRAIQLNDGRLKWEFNGVAGFVETQPLIYQDKVIFGAWDTYLYALNKKDGSLAWQWSNGNPGRLFSPAACIPVASANKVFIVAPDRFLTAIDVRTGETIWRTNAHKVRESIGISENGQTIYARCMEDTLLAISAAGTSPRLIWATSCGYGYDIAPSMPMERDGVIFFSTKNGYLFAVDAKTGAVKFQFRVGVAMVNTVNPIDGHHVLLTDMAGMVMLIESQR